MLRGVAPEGDDEPDPLAHDKRFANPLWDSHPYFNYIKNQYALNAQAVEHALADVDENLSETDRQRLGYFAHQIVDMMSPTNFSAPTRMRSSARSRPRARAS